MIRSVSLLGIVTVFCLGASAAAIDVSYTVSGAPGAWNLDFTVSNNLVGPSQDIYQFGVALSARNIKGSPAGYDPEALPVFFTFFDGGSSNVYNNNWQDLVDFNHLLSGTSLSGFKVKVSDIDMPTSVPWFAYSVTFDPADLYTGNEAFFNSPDLGIAGFEGVAEGTVVIPAATPEPSSMVLLSLGAIASAVFGRKLTRV
jgi:hypothetical protein